MLSDKQGVKALLETLVCKGLQYAVLSPGSRNAPLSLSFYRHPSLRCVIIHDERSAAYFALGMAQQLQKPVALICTSGTAVLNYAPAVAEAYYQQVPLLVITADRPVAWVDQADGQTIRQRNIFSNYSKASYEIPGEAITKEEQWLVTRVAAQAFDQTLLQGKGPVHLNVPLQEPLYGRSDTPLEVKAAATLTTETQLTAETLNQVAADWNGFSRKLILCGLLEPDAELNALLHEIAADPSVAVLTETTSNLYSTRFNPCIDRVITTVSAAESDSFRPDLLITLGGPVISKKIKAFLRHYAPEQHWHIDPNVLHLDTYQALTHNIPVKPASFFKGLSPLIIPRSSAYNESWQTRDRETDSRHSEFLAQVPFSDLYAFDQILNAIPEGSDLHLANSSPVRYAQLFRTSPQLTYHANRGTSGIDGCTSTAAGSAFINEKPTVLITGDVGFFYDSNALWNHYLKSSFRIVVIHNGGGGIFRIIEGPANEEETQQLFETRHTYSAEYLCKTFGIHYFSANDRSSLRNVLPDFFAPHDKPALLEIHTPTEENARILQDYFEHLKKQ